MTGLRSIALIGLPGSGKSTSGRVLAARLERPFRDLDAAIEASAGHTVAQLFEREGEAGFRRRETAMLERMSAEPAAVVACGGGAVIEATNRDLLKRRFITVWLQVDPAEAARRLEQEAETRPLLRPGGGPARLAALLHEREAWYREAAALEVNTDGRDPSAVVAPVMAFLASTNET